MRRCHDVEPRIETFTGEQAARLFGVKECLHIVARYNLTGTPRFFREDVRTALIWPEVEAQLQGIAAKIRGSPKVELSLSHAMLAKETDDETVF